MNTKYCKADSIKEIELIKKREQKISYFIYFPFQTYRKNKQAQMFCAFQQNKIHAQYFIAETNIFK